MTIGLEKGTMITSETKRAIGENRFEELCKIAGLECGKIEPDRTGKDKIVEWPIESCQQETPFDKRESRKRCEVQILSLIHI